MSTPGGPPWDEPPPSAAWQAPAPYEQMTQAPWPYGARTEGTAIGALVCGVAGLTLSCIGFIPGIVAVVLASQAKQRIAASGGALEGRGLAIAGQVLGWVSIALTILTVLGVILFAALHGSGSTDCPSC